MAEPNERPQTFFEKHGATLIIVLVFGTLVLVAVARAACR